MREMKGEVGKKTSKKEIEPGICLDIGDLYICIIIKNIGLLSTQTLQTDSILPFFYSLKVNTPIAKAC